MIEHWKKIENHPNYEISSEGKCRNVKNGHLLKPVLRKGYWRYGLDGKSIFAHRLVAEAFIPNPNNLPMINHKDENKANNSVSNLEWCDNTYNIRYSFCKPILRINKDNLDLIYYAGMSDAERIDGFDHSTISKCCRGVKKDYKNNLFFFEPPTVDDYLSELKCTDVVYSIDENGEYDYYSSARDAEKQTGISAASICSCYQGKRKSAGKRKWFKM